jgi:hypothetical protein
MALVKGALISFDDPLLGVVPTVVPFQYNPTEVTRTFTVRTASGDQSGVSGRNADRPAREEYTIKIELDATDALEHDGPITTLFGIAPRLAAIEMLVQPVATSPLGGQFGSRGLNIPPRRLPVTFFAWGARLVPVTLKSLTVRESDFNELGSPTHASADIGMVVLQLQDLNPDDKLARFAVDAYGAKRLISALLQLPQMVEFVEAPV